MNWALASHSEISCVKDILSANEAVARPFPLAPKVEFDWPPWHAVASTQHKLLAKYTRLYELAASGHVYDRDKNNTLTFASIDGNRRYMARQFDHQWGDLITGGLFAMKIEDSFPRFFLDSYFNVHMFLELELDCHGLWGNEHVTPIKVERAGYYLAHEVVYPTVRVSVLVVTNLAKNSSTIYINTVANTSELYR
jgi:hypothetical protein